MRCRGMAVVTAACLFFSICFAGLETAAAYGTEEAGQEISGDYAMDQVLVVFEEDVSKKEAAKVVEKKEGEDLTVLDTSQEELTGLVELPEDQTVEEAIKAYEKDPSVAYAQPNYCYRLIKDVEGSGGEYAAETKAATKNLNDIYKEDLWYLDTVQAEEAWELLEESGHSKTRVAVLDTGVDTTHPDLQENLNKELCRDFTGGATSTAIGDDDGHGTLVTGIIGATANNRVGVAGTAGNYAEVFVVDVFTYIDDPAKLASISAKEAGNYAYTSDVVQGLEYASQNGAKVINLSLGMNQLDKELETGINNAAQKGITIVCAAGNEGVSTPSYPADFEACISVIATTKNNTKAGYSNYGAGTDISAPGGDVIEMADEKEDFSETILSTYLTTPPESSGYAWSAGTSMAAPVVTGVVALLYYEDSSLTTDEIKEYLYNSAFDIYSEGKDIYSGHGIVNAYDAIQLLKHNDVALRVKLDRNSLTLSKGTNARLTASITAGQRNVGITWKSSNPSVATVSSAGVVTAINGGSAVITATADDQLGRSASCQVTVPYTISYQLGGGKNSAANPSSYYGSSVSLKNPTRKGYTFGGWYTSSSYGTRVSSLTSGNYTLYAKWNKVTTGRSSIKSLKRSSKTKLKVTHKKISGAKGYQVTYSTSKKFSKKKTKSLNTGSTKVTLKKLKKGKIYYVKVRAYKTDSTGVKVYGKYSKVKKIKMKK